MMDLVVARALWIVHSDAAPAAIEAATRALMEGVDSEPLRELAGESLDINVFELGALIESALNDAGVDTSGMTEGDAMRLVARHYAEQVIRDHMQAREFAGWAHSRIGHEGPAWAQDLVELDDVFDAFDGGGGAVPDWRKVLDRFLVESRPASQKWERLAR
jgi:hypothetical protein